VYLLAIHISVSQAQTNRVYSQMRIKLANYVIRLAQRVTAAGQLDVV